MSAFILNSIGDGIYSVDTTKNCTFINTKALEMLGYQKEEVIGHNTHKLFYDHYLNDFDLEERCCVFDHIFATKEEAEIRIWLRKKDGNTFPARMMVTPLIKRRKIHGAVVTFYDMSEHYQTVQRLNHQCSKLQAEVMTDHLTQAYNRRYLETILPFFIELFVKYDQVFSLISFDLDDFKSINDQCGHDMGDHVLKKIIATIKSWVRSEDIIVRMGGDEFLIILPDIRLSQAIDIAHRIQKNIPTLMYQHRCVTLSCSLSMGVVQIDRQVFDYDLLLRQVDQKLYEAKTCGKNCLKYEEPSLRSK